MSKLHVAAECVGPLKMLDDIVASPLVNGCITLPACSELGVEPAPGRLVIFAAPTVAGTVSGDSCATPSWGLDKAPDRVIIGHRA